MSGKKQVIHVKDLVIEADNVYVERPKHGHHDRDRFFESGDKHGRESRESSNERHHRESESKEHNNRRGPFDWF